MRENGSEEMIRIIKGNVRINNYIIPVFLEGKRRDHEESGKRKKEKGDMLMSFGGLEDSSTRRR
jgi:hypothetical protein